MFFLIAFVVFSIITVIYLVGVYNGLVLLIIQVLEQYVQYETDTIEKVVEARRNYGSANSVNEKIEASNQLSLALKGTFAVMEAYPDLKSNNNFTQLQKRISDLENQIAEAVLNEKANEIIKNLEEQMKESAKNLDFETAAKLRDQIKELAL